tara:strand:- start:4521 stop:6476 length:1956 start_codon:yes stop_codon:yes gene_type:complete
MSALIPEIKVSAESRENLGNWVGARLTRLEEAHSDFFNDIQVYWEWYEAESATKQKNFPWPGASNIVLPVIATACDSLIAQLYATIFSHGKLASARTLNESLKEHVQPVVDFMNWAADNEYNAHAAVHDWITELVVIGESVIAPRWDRKERWVLRPNGSSKPEKVQIGRGPLWEHIPRHRALWEPGQTIEESEIFSRQAYMSYSQVASMAQTGGWDKEATEEALRHPDTGSPQLRIEQAAAERAGKTFDPMSGDGAIYDIREVWIDAPIVRSFDEPLGKQTVDTKVSTLVVTMNRTNNTVLRVTADPYGLGHKPFYNNYFRKRSGQKTGRGGAKILEHMQRGQSVMMNQAVDSVTLGNSMPFRTSDVKLAKTRLSPGQGIYDPTMKGFDPINKGTSVVPEQHMINLLQVFAERALGQSDPLLGRESRSGGHPSPATNFLGMMEQGKILINPTVWGLRKTLGGMLEDTATMYQLFGTDSESRIVRTMGQRDGQKIIEFMFPQDSTIIGNISFDIFAADEQNSPQARQQSAVTRMQVSNNFSAFVLPLYQAVLNPELPPALRSVVADFIRGHTQTYIAFLEASDVDDIENYTPMMEELKSHGIGNLADFQQQTQQLLAQAQANQERPEQRAVDSSRAPAQAGQDGPAGRFRVQ